ncbi:uncharacterized protein LODBEIA_P05420 [Lodderomyces beijingensis]|uniref:F-box domain-containing protein n=1 Tax=Lodderomyces beijingensis TaxID=1775926 RepID=A0ABP0ZFH0_9ASCO
MIRTESIDFHNHLPPYRSLLNPNARYDYRTHKLIPLSQNDLNSLHLIFKSSKNNTSLKRNSFMNRSFGFGRSNSNSSAHAAFSHRHHNHNRNQPTPQPPQQQQQQQGQSESQSRRQGQDFTPSSLLGETELSTQAGSVDHQAGPPSSGSAFSTFEPENPTCPNSASSTNLKMKYRSLLNDVGRTISLRISNGNLLSNSPNCHSTGNHGGSVSRSSTILLNSNQPRKISNIKELPLEILDHIFDFVDAKEYYRNCLFTCKLFYYLSKPYYYENISLTSTYRLAQFITILRLNPEVGQYVKTIDLSNIKPGFDEDALDDDNQIIEMEEEIANEANNNHNNDHNNNQVNNRLNSQILMSSSNASGDAKVLAGWRDWKYKNNPLYTVHPVPTSALTKIASNSQVSVLSSKSNSSQKSSSSKRFSKPFKYFKSRKRSRSLSGLSRHNNNTQKKAPRFEYLKLQVNEAGSSRYSSPHPLINKFLLNYSTSKDVPVGYVLHIVNLCPNVISLDFGNLSLSADYEINRKSVPKYQNFDLLNNYPKDLLQRIDDCIRFDGYEDALSFENASSKDNSEFRNHFSGIFFKSAPPTMSTASSIYSVTTFSKPMRKYNSLLPPLPSTVADISYLKKGDGRVYLSDLNLKSINNAYLKKIDEKEVLAAIRRVHGKRQVSYNTIQSPFALNADIAGNLKYLNLSSMIWLNRPLVEKFLKRLLTTRSQALVPYGYYDQSDFSEADEDSDDESEFESLEQCEQPIRYKQDLVIDFTDSGMYKNLLWAQKIDLRTMEGCKLASRIIRNDLVTPQEDYMRRESRRRGRIGENYLA